MRALALIGFLIAISSLIANVHNTFQTGQIEKLKREDKVIHGDILFIYKELHELKQQGKKGDEPATTGE